VGNKKRGTLLLYISSPTVDRFSKFFHLRTLQTICNNEILVHIPPDHNGISTLPCEISMKYACIMIITNKHFGKNNISDQHYSEWSVWH